MDLKESSDTSTMNTEGQEVAGSEKQTNEERCQTILMEEKEGEDSASFEAHGVKVKPDVSTMNTEGQEVADVLDYDIEKNNWNVPGLWHGTPPMA
ncbi:hypothetical protein INR49_004510, partial [Caranx melampygus]